MGRYLAHTRTPLYASCTLTTGLKLEPPEGISMGRYTVRRLLQFIPVILGTLFLLHYLQTLSFQINGNPIRALFGDRQPPPETIEAMTRAYGLDDPCLEQTGQPLPRDVRRPPQELVAGNFGVRTSTASDVLDLIVARRPLHDQADLPRGRSSRPSSASSPACSPACARTSSPTTSCAISTMLVISVPIFVLGVLVQIFLGLYFGNWLRTREVPDALKAMFSVSYQEDYPWASLVIPAFVLGALSLGFIARLTRTSLIESLRSDYVRTARAKGLKPSRVVGVHALRNSPDPRRHLHRHRHRRPDGRRPHHRGHLQHPRASAGSSSARSATARPRSSWPW